MVNEDERAGKAAALLGGHVQTLDGAHQVVLTLEQAEVLLRTHGYPEL